MTCSQLSLGYCKMSLTTPSHLLESSILTKHKTLKAEETTTTKPEFSVKVGDLDKYSLTFKIDKSETLFKSDCERPLIDKPGPADLTANHLLPSNLFTAQLITYQNSALVSLKSSLLKSQTNNLAGIPVKLLNDKNTGFTGYHSGLSSEHVKSRVEGLSTRHQIPKISENIQRHKGKEDRRADKSSEKRQDKSSELKKKGKLQKQKPQLDKKETEEDGISSCFADKGIPEYNFRPNFKPEIVDLPKFLPPEKDHDILRSAVLAERLKERDLCLVQPKVCLYFLTIIYKNSDMH